MKRNELNINDLIRLAKMKSKKTVISPDDYTESGLMSTWLQELSIGTGHNQVKAGELYKEFKVYCQNKRRLQIPNKTTFGRLLNGILVKKRTSKGIYYMINYTAAELRERREKKEKQEANQK